MQQHDALAGNRRHMRFAQQGGAGGGGKAGADQEIAVAGNPVDVHAGIADGAKRRRHACIEGVFQVVVAGPVFEQVAQQIQGLRVLRMVFKKREKGSAGARVRALQMQVGNKECGRHCHRSTLP